MTVLKIWNLKICMGNHESVTGWQNFHLPLQSLLLTQTAENPHVT